MALRQVPLPDPDDGRPHGGGVASGDGTCLLLYNPRSLRPPWASTASSSCSTTRLATSSSATSTSMRGCAPIRVHPGHRGHHQPRGAHPAGQASGRPRSKEGEEIGIDRGTAPPGRYTEDLRAQGLGSRCPTTRFVVTDLSGLRRAQADDRPAGATAAMHPHDRRRRRPRCGPWSGSTHAGRLGGARPGAAGRREAARQAPLRAARSGRAAQGGRAAHPLWGNLGPGGVRGETPRTRQGRMVETLARRHARLQAARGRAPDLPQEAGRGAGWRWGTIRCLSRRGPRTHQGPCWWPIDTSGSMPNDVVELADHARRPDRGRGDARLKLRRRGHAVRPGERVLGGGGTTSRTSSTTRKAALEVDGRAVRRPARTP